MRIFLIGSDIGTSGTKSSIVDLKGNVLAQAFEGYPLYTPRAGWAEQNAEDWENAVYKTIRSVVRQSGVSAREIAGICVSGLFAGCGVPVDDNFNPVRNAIIWMDRRATAQADHIERTIGGKRLFALTGNGNDAYFGFNKILWIRDNEPDIFTKIALFLPSNSYIVYRLTGEVIIDYTSAANIGGIYDLRRNRWAFDMMNEMGIDRNLMPENFLEPVQIAGTLTRDAARKLDLSPGIPVCAGCTDCLASSISAGAIDVGTQIAVIGTSINWSVLHDKFPPVPELVTMPYAIAPKRVYYTYGGVTAAGALTKWFREIIAPYSMSSDEIVPTSFQMLEEEAEKIPVGSDGLLILPYFMGERSPIWDSNARGLVIGLSLHHTRANIYRAILEASAFAVKHIMEVSDLFKGENKECVVSGGAVHSKLWMQIISDVTGFTLKTVSGDMQAPVGDALIAGVAAGVIDSFGVIDSWRKYGAAFVPDLDTHKKYAEIFEYYKELYENTKNCMHFLASICR
ncbi:MAG: FGGY-family carbohydrate kinase [Synergistaceae bacterium]|jgi:xylulokinase|nr:FGGY-family carbohydrate kinase [Synergistaceae bacterium]